MKKSRMPYIDNPYSDEETGQSTFMFMARAIEPNFLWLDKYYPNMLKTASFNRRYWVIKDRLFLGG